MAKSLKDKEVRIFISSGVIFVIGLILILLLMFVDLPEGNTSLINILIGAYSGALGLAVNRFIGSDEEEINKLKEKIQGMTDDCEAQTKHLVEENLTLKARMTELASRLDDLQSKLIDKNF